MRFTICAIPPTCWVETKQLPEPHGLIQDLIQDALAIERRLAKRINAEIERKRYDEVCELLENVALESASILTDAAQSDPNFTNHRIPAIQIGSDYFDLLLTISGFQEKVNRFGGSRVGASLIHPVNVERHADCLEELAIQAGLKESQAIVSKLSFLRRYVIPNGCGVVEAQTQDFKSDISRPTARQISNSSRSIHPSTQAVNLATGKSDEERMRYRVEMGLQTGAPVNMNNQNHIVITKVLAEFLLKHDTEPSGQIRVSYADGSEALPFPLRCLSPAPHPSIRPEKAIHVALLSMRHLLLDREVAINWFRNREIDLSSTLGHSDNYCFEHSRRQLETLRKAYQGDRVLIHLYHTGFEPAVVGFYRAVVESILRRGPWLRVMPRFFKSDHEFDDGPSWPPVQGDSIEWR